MSSASNSDRVLAELTSVRSLSPSTLGIKIHVRTNYSWQAGEYLSVSLSENGEESAYYSIAAAPKLEAPGVLELVVKGKFFCGGKEPQVGQDYWLARAQGRLNVASFAGANQLILIAMGTGIAPLRAIVQAVNNLEDQAPRVILLQGCRQLDECLFHDEFMQSYSEMDYRPILSAAPTDWKGLRGYVQQHLEPLPVNDDVVYGICGSASMVRDVRACLLEKGLKPEQILTESDE